MTTIVRERGAQRESASVTRVAGLALFALAAQFMTVLMLGASMAPGYDVARGAISDLGVIPQTALLFNASLLIVGVLSVLSGWLLYRSHRRAWIFSIFTLAGLGAAGAGLVPLDRGGLHGLFALAAFVFFNVEAIALATITHGAMRWVSILAGVIGLAFVVIMIIGDSGNTAVFGPIGHGGAERMIVYPPMLWLMTVGGYLMAASSASPGGRT